MRQARLTLWNRKSGSCLAARADRPPSIELSPHQAAAADHRSKPGGFCFPWQRQDSLSILKNHLGHHLCRRHLHGDPCPLRWLAGSIELINERGHTLKFFLPIVAQKKGGWPVYDDVELCSSRCERREFDLVTAEKKVKAGGAPPSGGKKRRDEAGKGYSAPSKLHDHY